MLIFEEKLVRTDNPAMLVKNQKTGAVGSSMSLLRDWEESDYAEIPGADYKAQLAEEAKAVKYKEEIVRRIRARYDADDEAAILRQRDTKPEEFAEYNAYCEECKRLAKAEIDKIE